MKEPFRFIAASMAVVIFIIGTFFLTSCNYDKEVSTLPLSHEEYPVEN